MYYQPIVDFKHNRVRSVEALLRLRKDGKLLTPYHFMKGIEDANIAASYQRELQAQNSVDFDDLLILAARPHIFGHNLETVERLTPIVRFRAQYQRSLRPVTAILRRLPERVR